MRQLQTNIARWLGFALAVISCASAQPVRRAPSKHLDTRRHERVQMPVVSERLVPSRQPTVNASESSASPSPELARLTVFFVDVGQGDATVVVGPGSESERRVLVIDAGPLHGPDGGAAVRQLMQNEGIEHVDYAIVTHFDADHLGGFVTTQGSTSLFWGKDCTVTPLFPRLAVYEHFTAKFTTEAAREWDRCIRPATNRVRVTKSIGLGDTLELGGGYSAQIIAGDGYVLGRDQRVPKARSENSRSVVTLVRGPGDFELLIPGDATGQPSGAERAEVEVALGEYLVSNGIDIEVLRVGHHGAENTSNRTFIEAAKPEVAIISVGDRQPANFRHPRCMTYATLAAMNVKYVIQTEAGKPDCSQPEPMPIVAHRTIRMDVTGPMYRIMSVELPTAVATGPIEIACTLSECSSLPAPDTTSPCCRLCSTEQPCGAGRDRMPSR